MRVAAVQAAPVWLDRAATIGLVTTKIEEAAAGGARLVAFPETFVPGYPVWVDITNTAAWEDPAQQAAFAWYLDQSVTVDGPEFDQVVTACRDTGVFGYVGIVERSRSGGSVYCSLVAIDPIRGWSVFTASSSPPTRNGWCGPTATAPAWSSTSGTA
jgi:nitrilase